MFEHSEKVPQLYKISSKCLQQIIENGASLKETVYNQKRQIGIKSVYALVTKTLQHYSAINKIIDQSELLKKEPRFNPWLARVLITQLFWSENGLKGTCRPIQTILSYYSTLEKCSLSLSIDNEPSKKVCRPRYVRVNTLLLSVDQAIEGFCNEGWEFVDYKDIKYDEFIKKATSLENYQFMLDFHIKQLLVFPQKTELFYHEAYKSKLISLQDKASCIPVHLLNPPPGGVVLDMCAAPGLKTTFLAECIQNKGTVYAVEKDTNRYNTLNKIIEGSGATCIKTINKDVLTVLSEECPNVEYILVDPTCSGSGILDRVNIDDVETVDEARLNGLSHFQILALKYALTKFPLAKRVVYSTCSVYSQENEYVIGEVLQRKINFKLICANSLLNNSFSNNLEQKVDDPLISIRNKCIYTSSERDLTNGFFVAVFERNVDTENGDNNTDHEVTKQACDEEQVSIKKKKRKLYEELINEVKFENIKTDQDIGTIKKEKNENFVNNSEIIKNESYSEQRENMSTEISKEQHIGKRKKRKTFTEKTNEELKMNFVDSPVTTKREKEKDENNHNFLKDEQCNSKSESHSQMDQNVNTDRKEKCQSEKKKKKKMLIENSNEESKRYGADPVTGTKKRNKRESDIHMADVKSHKQMNERYDENKLNNKKKKSKNPIPEFGEECKLSDKETKKTKSKSLLDLKEVQKIVSNDQEEEELNNEGIKKKKHNKHKSESRISHVESEAVQFTPNSKKKKKVLVEANQDLQIGIPEDLTKDVSTSKKKKKKEKREKNVEDTLEPYDNVNTINEVVNESFSVSEPTLHENSEVSRKKKKKAKHESKGHEESKLEKRNTEINRLIEECKQELLIDDANIDDGNVLKKKKKKSKIKEVCDIEMEIPKKSKKKGKVKECN